MTENLSRAFACDLEVRNAADGRVLAGLVVPYNREAVVSDGGPAYREMFVQGAVLRSAKMKRIPLLSQHDMRSNPLGVADPDAWREDAAGLYGEFRIPDTTPGNEALALVRAGALDSFSIGFRPMKHVKRDGVTVRTEVALREVSLVTFPAYEDARIQAVRDSRVADLIARGYTPESVQRAMESGDLLLLEFSGNTAADLTTATTADERSEQEATHVEDPASATPDVNAIHRALRVRARELGVF